MIVFGRVEGHGFPDLGCRIEAHLDQFAEHVKCRVAFRGVVEPDGRQILRSDVDALSINLFKIMDFKKIID